MNNAALFKIGYGLYLLTAKEGVKDNGCIINTLMQVTGAPSFIGVIAVNKQNYTHDMIMNTREFNISMLTVETPFKVFEHFGFQSGRDMDKFAQCDEIPRSENGLIYLPKYTNAYISCRVTDTVDFGSHTMFRADIKGGEVLSDIESLTYEYYQKHIKPRPEPTHKKGYRCTVCGYVYEGEPLPENFICPICKHGASDFVKI